MACITYQTKVGSGEHGLSKLLRTRVSSQDGNDDSELLFENLKPILYRNDCLTISRLVSVIKATSLSHARMHEIHHREYQVSLIREKSITCYTNFSDRGEVLHGSPSSAPADHQRVRMFRTRKSLLRLYTSMTFTRGLSKAFSNSIDVEEWRSEKRTD